MDESLSQLGLPSASWGSCTPHLSKDIARLAHKQALQWPFVAPHEALPATVVWLYQGTSRWHFLHLPQLFSLCRRAAS